MNTQIRINSENIVIFHYNSKGQINPYTTGAYRLCLAIRDRFGADGLAEKIETQIKPHFKGKGVEFWLFKGIAYYDWNILAKHLIDMGHAVAA